VHRHRVHRPGRGGGAPGRAPGYKCKKGNHLTRNVAHTDELVVKTILARLSRRDAVELLTPARPEIGTEALRAQASAIRANLNEMAADQILGMVTKEQLHAATAIGKGSPPTSPAQGHACFGADARYWSTVNV
jgi:hypothetical protein